MESAGERLCKRGKEKELSGVVPEKRIKSNYNRSKKGKEPQICLNEDIDSGIETTSKIIKEAPESSVGTNQNASLPAKGTLVAVLALSAEKIVKQRVSTNNSKSKNRVEKKLASAKTSDTHKELSVTQQDNQKKRRSIRGDQTMAERGISKLLNTAEDVTHKVYVDTLCDVQNQDVRIHKSLEAESKPDKNHKEVGNKLSNTLANNNSVRDPIEENVDPVDGITCIDAVCEVKNQEVLPSKSLEAASEVADEHEEMCEALPDALPLNCVLREMKRKSSSESERRSKCLLERERKKLSNILINNHSDQNQDNSDQLDDNVSITSPNAVEVNRKVRKENKKEVQAYNHLVGTSETTDKQEVRVTPRKKRSKDKGHDVQRNENILDSGCNSDIAEVSEQALLGNISNKKMRSADNHSVVHSPCSSGHTKVKADTPNLCNDTNPPSVNLGGLKTYQRKDRNICSLANDVESSIYEDQIEVADNCSNDLEKKDETNSKNKDELDISPNVPHQPYKKYHEEERMGQPLTVGKEIIKDLPQKRSGSPETTHTSQLRRKLLILDLNGLLVDIVSFLPEGYKADAWISRKALIKRPFCDDFLKFCFETFDVGVWSSRTRRNVDTVIDFIMGDQRHKLLFCWDQYHCTDTGFGTVEHSHKPMILKELKKVWYKLGDYDESNTILLDDSPYKALLNPPYTAIFPCSYEFRKANDNAVGPGGDIRTYLEKLAAAPHVQKFIEQNPFGQRAVTKKNPSWGYYLRVINANRFSLPT